MTEVGGDFFHHAEIGRRTRIVVGNVSGNRLGAAMLVSTLIGALDSNLSTNPAAVLKQLNDLLLARQQSRFVTCLCACIDRNALVTVCNAGYLAPYRSGAELMIASALPLGIAPDGSCSETAFQLAPGDRLTFVSDGIVEAQSATGEMFGFDRTCEISGQSAEEIVSAAQRLGQPRLSGPAQGGATSRPGNAQ